MIEHLKRIYPALGDAEIRHLAGRITGAAGIKAARKSGLVGPVGATEDPSGQSPPPALPGSDEVVLITYADTFTQPDTPGLQVLGEFLEEHLDDLVATVHVLPFLTSSSDGGFSIVDYREVAASLGDWADVAALATHRQLMVDVVCNHGSAQSEWFKNFIADRDPGRSFFRTARLDDDLSAVVRPRTHPLLLPVETAAGLRHVWATFSHDQIDFDFSNPDVLVEFCEILGFYLDHGATRVRLDAIAYLWKEVGTTCVHLPQTHEVVKLMRALMAARAPDSLLITETNVPHARNVSYFGDGDEAQVVYNFTLAPLIVWSLIVGDAHVLTDWLRQLDAPPQGCTFLNFLASHDGIGLRPVEDLISAERLQPLLDEAQATGGGWSDYSTPDGPRPYELNVSLVDLLAGPDGETAQRFVLAHALMLAVQGIPAIYVHSMLVSPGDPDAVTRTGHKRDINRASISREDADLQITSGWRGGVFRKLKTLVRQRRSTAAFAPESAQIVHAIGRSVVAIERGSGPDRVLALHNMTEASVTIELPDALKTYAPEGHQELVLDGWQALWLETQRIDAT